MDITPATWLPVAFVGLMGLAVLLYVILDGYDLGVGILSGTCGASPGSTGLGRTPVRLARACFYERPFLCVRA